MFRNPIKLLSVIHYLIISNRALILPPIYLTLITLRIKSNINFLRKALIILSISAVVARIIVF